MGFAQLRRPSPRRASPTGGPAARLQPMGTRWLYSTRTMLLYKLVCNTNIRRFKLGRDTGAVANRAGLSARDELGKGTNSSLKAVWNQCRRNHWDVDHSAWGPVRAQSRSRVEIAAANLAAAASAVPQVTTSTRANCAKLESARRDLNLRLAETEIKITAGAFQTVALARVLRKLPKFNSLLSADGKRFDSRDRCLSALLSISRTAWWCLSSEMRIRKG